MRTQKSEHYPQTERVGFDYAGVVTPNFRTVIYNGSYGIKPKPSDFEHPKGESLSVPNEAYTIREIMEKHTHGINLGIDRQGIYEDEVDFDSPDMRKVKELDLYDREIISKENAENITRGKQLLDEENKKQKARSDQEKIELEELKKLARERAQKKGDEIDQKTQENNPKKPDPKRMVGE